MAEASRRRAYQRPGDILLSAGFYAAARRLDGESRLQFRATDEQLLAGIALFRGRVAQMDAGEGKTVAIAFAAALHALLGRRVHVVTANDYLAERDAALLEPVYRSLGISAGAVPAYMEEAERRHVYRRSIVYGSMRELGFDYLRDNLKTSSAEGVQQPLDVAIVDEADHALIDEAFTPLIISGNPAGGSRMAVRVNEAVAEMITLQHRLTEEQAGNLAFPSDNRTDKPPGKPRSQLPVLATLLLADPDNTALACRFSQHPRLRRQAAALAEDDCAELSAGLHYAIHPGSRFVTLTEKGREFLERRLGPFPGASGSNPQGGDSQEGNPQARSFRQGAGARAGVAGQAQGQTRNQTRTARRYALENQVSQALAAHLFLKRDVDYLVDSGPPGDDGSGDGSGLHGPSDGDSSDNSGVKSIVLIDQHTGRPKPDSIYQHGLQAAVEAREGVPVQPERETLAQISVSGFVSGYRSLAGITGTAISAANEFRRKYGLEVSVIPPVHPPKRTTIPPVVYLSRQDKLTAVVDEVVARHGMGQPVLSATRTVEQSEELSRLLAERGTPHRVLNAVNTPDEARIVRDAGTFGAVTVATHMAGRGTDIVPEPRLNTRLMEQCAAEARRMLTEGPQPLAAVEIRCPTLEQAEALCEGLAAHADLAAARYDARYDAVHGRNATLRVTLRDSGGAGTDVGRLDFALGLCVIGTEIQDSARITLQLDGRSGRQGQFGLARTFLSLEDRLVNLDADAILKLSGCRGTDSAGRVRYCGPEVTRRIERLQSAADREGEAQRGLIQDYAAELDRQTALFYQRRRRLMAPPSDLSDPSDPNGIAVLCHGAAERVAARVAAAYLGPEFDGDYAPRFAAMAQELRQRYAVDCTPLYGSDVTMLPAELAALLMERLEWQARQLAQKDQTGESQRGEGQYGESQHDWGKGSLDNGGFREAARLLYLQVCGDLWPGHIALLRDSIGSQLLTGHSHKSSVAQYIRRSVEAWAALWERVDAEFLSRLSTLTLTVAISPPVTVSAETESLLSTET